MLLILVGLLLLHVGRRDVELLRFVLQLAVGAHVVREVAAPRGLPAE